MNIKFDVKGIGKLLADGNLYVPVHQREYFWKPENAIDLYNDFHAAIGLDRPHFLGSVVLRTSGDELEVNDGQQRLATATIMLSIIRDTFFKRKENDLAGHAQKFLSDFDLESEGAAPKLRLNKKDNEYFRKAILAAPDSAERSQSKPLRNPSNEKLKAVTGILRSKFDEMLKGNPEQTRKDLLKRWMNFIEKKAVVVTLTVDKNEDAYMLFETLNDRGLKVSEADLVKSSIFRMGGEKRLPEVVSKWDSMVTLIESLGPKEDVIDYLRILASILYGLTREREVFDTISKNIASETAAVNFVHQIESFASDYVGMLSPDDQKWNDYPPSIRKSLRTLALFDVMQIRYLMLAVAHHFAPREAANAFALFVNWIVRFFIAGAEKIGRVDSVYARLAHTIHTTNDIKSSRDLSSAMAPHLANDAEFEAAFTVAKVSQGKLARFYLDALERKTTHEEDAGLVPDDDTSRVNLEHIIPLNTSTHWGHIDKDLAASLYNRLGNMALLNARKNARLGDVGFVDKKKTFSSSPFVLTRSVCKFRKWGADEIGVRQSELARLAVTTWPIKI